MSDIDQRNQETQNQGQWAGRCAGNVIINPNNAFGVGLLKLDFLA